MLGCLLKCHLGLYNVRHDFVEKRAVIRYDAQAQRRAIPCQQVLRGTGVERDCSQAKYPATIVLKNEVRFNISESDRTNSEKTGRSVLIECEGQGCVNEDFLLLKSRTA
ncbi:uncharacterized protein [Montipora capricornis]|uniref:uncharacterized protein n=1 Tax=Montipora capricornis TaxID=246305 RepID=UPI0035F1C84F